LVARKRAEEVRSQQCQREVRGCSD